jgi:hypothetical protein
LDGHRFAPENQGRPRRPPWRYYTDLSIGDFRACGTQQRQVRTTQGRLRWRFQVLETFATMSPVRHRPEVSSSMRSKYLLVIVSIVVSLCGCSSLTFAPNRVGAKNECATDSANLPMYNDCVDQVDTFYDEYELHRKQTESDGR